MGVEKWTGELMRDNIGFKVKAGFEKQNESGFMVHGGYGFGETGERPGTADLMGGARCGWSTDDGVVG